MKTPKKPKRAVTHRTKGDKTPNRPARRLADEPALKELARMIDAGEVDRARTLSHLRKGRKK